MEAVLKILALSSHLEHASFRWVVSCLHICTILNLCTTDSLLLGGPTSSGGAHSRSFQQSRTLSSPWL